MSVTAYLDTNILSRSYDFELPQIEAEGIEKLSSAIDRVQLYTSEKAKRELEKTKDDVKRPMLLFVYNLLLKIPTERITKFVPAMFGAIMFGESTFGGGANRVDPLFTKIKTFFDPDDAEHVFQAEKTGVDYFVTFDARTIHDRIKRDPATFNNLNLRLKFVFPSQLCSILALK